VGVTRARDRLTLSLAATRMKWGKPRPSIPSRFLFELRGEAEKATAVAVKSTREAKGAPVAGPKGKPKPQTPRAKRPASGAKPKQR